MQKPSKVFGIFLTHERVSRLLLGTGIILGLIIQVFIPWLGLGIIAFTAVNQILFSITGKCKFKNALDHFQVPYECPPEGIKSCRVQS